MFARAARLTAQLCLAYGVRPWFVGRIGLRLGRTGVTTHNEVSQAFGQSSHWDPGAWPRRKFMRAVRREVKAIKKGEATVNPLTDVLPRRHASTSTRSRSS